MPEKTTHPSPEELSAFSLGQLPPEEAAVVECHISECQPCCQTLLGLSSDDTFVALLKEAKRLPPDRTAAHDVLPATPSSPDVPAPLAEHPRYEIIGLIGKGGMGDVYKARHRMMDRTVALKVINRELVRNPEAVDRFHREVKTAAQLSHPNIVTAYDAEQAGDVHFLVMEFVDGVDMSRVIKDRGPLPIADACDYVRQAAIGLQHAHERGMVHRDIKPHNLMVTADGTVKILDFGLASLAPEAVPDADTVEARGDLTAAGAIMGTPDFISPEQADDARQADIRSDIYSLGTTLYFLLSGRPPFADGSVMQKLKSHAQADAEPLESLRDDISAGLSAVVSRMIAKDPDERFQTPAEVAEALARCSASPWPPVQPRRQRGRFLPLTAVATLLVAVIIAAVVFYIQTNNGTVRVEVTDPSLEVTIAGQTVTMEDGNKEPLTIRAGEQKLTVRQGDSDFALETDRFEIRRDDKIAFKVELLPGEVVVSRDGERFGAKTLPDADNVKKAEPTSPVSPEIAALFAEAGASESEAAEFQDKLYTILSQAAGIPNAQWEKFTTDPTSGSTAKIEGEPLSLWLLTLDPVKAAKENPAALADFRWLTDGIPKPTDLAKAMSISSPRGYVSIIQPEYIKRTPIDLKGGEPWRGSVEFEAPNLYAGKVNFVIRNAGPRMQVVEFELPNHGIVLVRDEQGVWRRQRATDHVLIQGVWQVTHIGENGQPIPPRPEVPKDSLRLRFAKDTMTGADGISTFPYKLDPSTTPKSLDITNEDGRTTLGIYDLRGDTLRICQAKGQAERPTSFGSRPDSPDNDSMILKRIRVPLEQRRRLTLDMLKYMGGRPEDLDVRYRLVAALRKATPKSLGSPTLVSAAFRGNVEEKTGSITVNWISSRPVANGLLLNMKDGSSSHWQFGAFYLEANEEKSEGVISFGAAIDGKSHPLQWQQLELEEIESVQLAEDAEPVGNVCVFRLPRKEGGDVDPKTSCAARIKLLEQALELYMLDNGTYPSTRQGLKALCGMPTDGNGLHVYLHEPPKDPWGNDFGYEFPNTRGGDATKPTIWSWGPDGEDHTEDDITNGEPGDSTPMDQIAKLLDRGYTIVDNGKTIGSRRLVVTERARNLSIVEECSLALKWEGAPLGIVERDFSTDYSLAGGMPRILSATSSTKEQGALVMHATVEFTNAAALTKWTSYTERGHRLETPRKHQATVKPPSGPIVFGSTIQVVGPLLLPKDGEREVVWGTFDALATAGKPPVEYEAGYKLRRTARPDGAGSTITLLKPDRDNPEMTLEYDDKGTCKSIRQGGTTVMKPLDSAPPAESDASTNTNAPGE